MRIYFNDKEGRRGTDIVGSMRINQLRFEFQASLWRYDGPGGWHFISVPADESATIREELAYLKRSWGSIAVRASIGRTTWNTSVFPDSKTNNYLLPVKGEVRKKESIVSGQTVDCVLIIEV